MRRGSFLLTELVRKKSEYGGNAAQRKLGLLAALEVSRMARAREVRRLHEALCFLRAYPDDASVLAQVERMLAGFDRRSDLTRHRKALADSGIAGTATRYRFYAPTASWLAGRWGDRLTIDWKELGDASKLEPFLQSLALYCETPGLDQLSFSTREWIGRMKGPGETDAAFFLRRFEALATDPFVREAIYDGLDVPMVLASGPDTPSRTRARLSVGRVHCQKGPLVRSRPALPDEIACPPRSVRFATPGTSRDLIELARGMMVTMSRDLDVFSYASEEDVRLVDCGRGLVFAFIGFIPERRLMLETLYGYVILKNGVPIGYGSVASLFRSSEVAYNVSEAFRGGEAALVFARLLACVRRLFGSDTFSLDPYQLGEDNQEALRSGAWWFYHKLGFLSRDASVLRLMRQELRQMKSEPGHRSTTATLKRLAASSVFLELGKARDDVIGVLPLANVGLRTTAYLAERFGSDRESAAATCSREAARLTGVRSFKAFSPGERLAWERWAPLVLVLPGVERWSAGDRHAAAEVIRAKGGRRESDFLARFDAHRRLRMAIADIAAQESGRPHGS